MFKPAADALPPQHGIKRYFFVQKYIFSFIGIDPTSLERPICSKFLAWMPLTSTVVLCIPFIMFIVQNMNDLNAATETLTVMLESFHAILKTLYFLYNHKEIIQLFRKIWLWNLEARGEEVQIISDENRKDTTFSIIFYSSVLFTVVFALGGPLGIAFLYYLKGYGFLESLRTPLKGAYFIDTHTYLGYTFVYVWNAVLIYFVINGSLSTDTLFSWLMHNVSAQFRILNLRFKCVAEARRKLKNDEADDEQFRKSLILCIKYHRRVIDLAQHFNDVFKVTVFIKFTISFLQIAFLAFQFSRGGEIAAHMFHFFFLISVALQMLLYSHGGQRIKDGSNSVATTIYDYFEWHNLSSKSKKILLMTIMRSQRPCNLTGIFFVADLNLFLWVFKTAGSFITMLLTLEDKNPK